MYLLGHESPEALIFKDFLWLLNNIQGPHSSELHVKNMYIQYNYNCLKENKHSKPVA